MIALLVYIDDWFGSPAIQDMDGDEERGYFRLCLHAAKLEYDGLPDDDRKLAIWSRLEDQWFKPTKDKKYRSDLTSGEKIRACFIAQNGRLYNGKVLKCVDEHHRRSDHGAKAANARWSKMPEQCPSNARASVGHEVEHMPEYPLGNATRVGSESNTTNNNEQLIAEVSKTTESVSRKKTVKPTAVEALSAEKREWFFKFYTAYWRHKARDDAAKAFDELVRSEQDFSRVMQAIEAQTPEMSRRSQEHIPYPASWLRDGQMHDETTPETALLPVPSVVPGVGSRFRPKAAECGVADFRQRVMNEIRERSNAG